MSKIFWNSVTESIGNIFDEPSESKSKSKNKNDIQTMFLEACTSGNLEIVNECLANGVDPSINRNQGLQTACTNGYITIVDVLLQQKNVDPSTFHKNSTMSAVCYNGHISIVDRLLHDEKYRYDSTEYAIRTAAYKGFTDIVVLLIQHEKQPMDSQVIEWVIDYVKQCTSENNFFKIVDLFNQYDKIRRNVKT
jgi:ankyrin repeat protein